MHKTHTHTYKVATGGTSHTLLWRRSVADVAHTQVVLVLHITHTKHTHIPVGEPHTHTLLME